MLPAAAVAVPPDPGVRVGCESQSEAGFPRAFSSRANLVIGPLAMIGAGGRTSAATVEEFGGNKFPLLVKAGHTVTITVARSSPGALEYGGRRRARRVTFRACGPAAAASEADGRPVTFWSGSVRLSRPACVRLRVRVDDHPAARSGRIRMGLSCRSGT